MPGDTSTIGVIVERIESASYRAAEIVWRSLRSSDEAKNLTASDYATVIEAWLYVGEVHRAREVFDSCPHQGEDLRILEWEIQDGEEAILLGESVYPAGLPMSERWVVPSFIPDREKVNRWLPGRIVNADDPLRPSVVWARRSLEGEGARAFFAFHYDFKEGDLDQWEIVPPMKIVEGQFFIATQSGSDIRMYPVICDPAPWTVGRRAEKLKTDLEKLDAWARSR